MITHQSICFACTAIWNKEREREREKDNLDPQWWRRVGSSSSSLEICPSVRNFLVRYFIISHLTFLHPRLGAEDARVETAAEFCERRRVHLMNKSGSVHPTSLLPFMLHQGQVLSLSCFSAAFFFIFLLAVLCAYTLGTSNHHLKTPVGFGLDWICFFSFFRWGVVGYSTGATGPLFPCFL